MVSENNVKALPTIMVKHSKPHYAKAVVKFNYEAKIFYKLQSEGTPPQALFQQGSLQQGLSQQGPQQQGLPQQEGTLHQRALRHENDVSRT